MAQFVINVMSKDRTGIVADVTRALKTLDGNLEDMTQTVLRDYFTMILVVSFDGEQTCAGIKQSLREDNALAGLEIGVVPFEGTAAETKPVDEDTLYVLTSSGPDKPGLVATVSEALRQKKVNIVDLNTRSHNGIYNMIYLLSIPAGTDIGKLKRSLQVLMGDMGLALELRHQALFRKTNEI